MGLEKILNSDPKFAEEHYDRNFNNINNSKIQFSSEEQDYIASKQAVTVAW